METENASAAAESEREAETVSREWATMSGRKADKERHLHQLQEEYTRELNAKEGILQNREAKIECEVNLCR